MRIVIFTNSYKPTISGVVRSIDVFRKGLIAAGHEVCVITPEREDYEDEEPYIFRFPALELPERLDLSLVIPLKTPMAATVRGIKPALIHSQHPFVMGGLASAFARDLKLPLIFTFHTRYDAYAKQYIPLMPALAGMLTTEIVKRYLEKCTIVIAPTPSIRDLILREYGADVPVVIVPTPVDLNTYHDLEPDRIRAKLNLEEAEILLYVGRLVGEKNLDLLLRAFAIIAPRRPQARLLMVGDGTHRQYLENMAKDLGLGERVIFPGAIPQCEVPHYDAAADLFVFPSLTDTQGLVLIEAMAAGTPVVAVEAPGPMDVLAEGGGVLAPPREEAFAEAMLRFLADDSRRRALEAQASRAAQRYSIPYATERLLAVYEAAIAAGPIGDEKRSAS